MYGKFLALLTMIFLHIVDDYYLQGILASMKQKKWWEENAPDKLYKYDYIMALFMHSFSWTFMIMIVPFIYVYIERYNDNISIFNAIYLFIFNLCIHMFVDNTKANKLEINLITDQIMHLAQILITWFYVFILV